MGFVMHWHESAMELQAFPIPIPRPFNSLFYSTLRTTPHFTKVTKQLPCGWTWRTFLWTSYLCSFVETSASIYFASVVSSWLTARKCEILKYWHSQHVRCLITCQTMMTTVTLKNGHMSQAVIRDYLIQSEMYFTWGHHEGETLWKTPF